MIDLPVWDYGWFVKCNVNNPDFLERDRIMTIALVKFLQEHDLLKKRMLEDGEEPPKDFVIKQSDLTEKGLAFDAIRTIDRWLRANDDIRKPLNMRGLERALKKIS